MTIKSGVWLAKGFVRNCNLKFIKFSQVFSLQQMKWNSWPKKIETQKWNPMNWISCIEDGRLKFISQDFVNSIKIQLCTHLLPNLRFQCNYISILASIYTHFKNYSSPQCDEKTHFEVSNNSSNHRIWWSKIKEKCESASKSHDPKHHNKAISGLLYQYKIKNKATQFCWQCNQPKKSKLRETNTLLFQETI